MSFALSPGTMSKHNNVNPNFYKVDGREHTEPHGQAVPHEQQKQQLRQDEASLPGQKKTAKRK
jgi:hypothetical protein